MKILKKIGSGHISISFTSRGNKHLIDDYLHRTHNLAKDDLEILDAILQSSEYVRTDGISKPRKDRITEFHYFKGRSGKGKHIYLNVATERGANSHIKRNYLYSITDVLRKK